VVSARVSSPTFGGASWLAHAALLAGVDPHDPRRHALLLASTRPTLVQHFAHHGWRTVGWMPGLKRPWPEGAFYGFDRLADDAGIGYVGPDFGYWRIPDQAAMALLHAQELTDPPSGSGVARAPRFVVFPTTSTHAPFQPLAPVVDDWPRLLGPHAYDVASAASAADAPTATGDPSARYVDGQRDQFRWIADYLRQLEPRGLVLVIVGDHQPPAVSGLNRRGADDRAGSWDVPVHIVADDPALLRRLQREGFVPGLVPPAAAIGPMHALTGVLLRAFDAAPALTAPSGVAVSEGGRAGVSAPDATRARRPTARPPAPPAASRASRPRPLPPVAAAPAVREP
jgi:hypothetical protein